MKRLLAGLGLIAVAVGAPAALTATAGKPSLPAAGSFGGLDSTYLPLEPALGVLAMLAWVVWTYLLLAVLLRAFAVIVAQRTGRTSLVRATSRLAPRPLRRWVDLAVGGAFLASTFSVGRAVALPTPAPAIAVVAPAQPAPAKQQPAKEVRRYVVRPGDSLWAIAERELGSGFRWREIFGENKGRRFPDGRCLENPRLIHPGWDLRLPANGRSHAVHLHEAEPPIRTTPTPTTEAVEGVPTPTRQTPTPTAQPSTESPAEATPEAQPSDEPSVAEATPPRPAPVITLPSGAIVASSFACGVLSAELLTRLRRRRARRLLLESSEVEMPERLVRDMRHAGATPATTTLDVAVDEVIAAWRVHTSAPPRLLAVTEERRRVCILLDARLEHGLPKPAGGRMSPALRFEHAGAYVKAEVRGPFPQRLRRIATTVERGLLVPLGHVAKTAVHVAPLGMGVISITGEEARGVVRQLLLAQAAEAGPDDLQITLLGIPGGSFASLPQVTASRGWDDATGTLQEIQAEFIRRARLFQREGVEDIGEHLAAHADEQLTALVIVAADPPSSMRGVLDAVAQEVRRYGGTLIAVGWQPATSSLHITADAGSLDIETELPLPARIAAFSLDEQMARDVEDVIRNASPHDQGDETSDLMGSPEEAVPLPSVPAVEPKTAECVELPPRGRTPKVAPPPDLPAVRCLGSFRITRDGNARVKGWRTKSRELLAFLVAHPGGATKERIMDELWPGADPERLQALFEKAVSVVRTQVRGNDDPRMYVMKVEDSWQLEDGAWWIDAREFDQLTEQATGSGEAESVEHLRQAIGLYTGDFCAELAYPWAEAVRERYRSSFTRACARLGEMLSAGGELDEALEVLDRAIGADPLCEDLWRRAMTIESRLGRKAAAKERFERLRALLASELDVEPDPETQRVALAISTRRPPFDSRVADAASVGGSGTLSGV